MCLFLILLVYLLSGVLPLPSTIDLLRDLVDPENVLLDAAVVALRRRAIVVEPTVSPPQDVGSAAAPEIAPVVAPERPTESLLLLGERLAKDGLRRRHPVVFVPGITSSGLELWSGLPCARRHFRQRLWGDVAQANKLLVSVDCWLQHMRLDNATGTDPPGVRLRAASGLAAADVVMGAYSLWAGLVQQLAALGYDEAMIHLAAYDWRLRFDLLEERDRYFSKLKAQVELMSEVAGGRPVVFVSHSMGFNVVSYFFQWVHSRAATGRQCPHLPAAERAAREASWSQADTDGALPAACDGWWARRYIRTWVNLAGSAAGSPKGLVSWYSGQMGNLAAVNPLFGAMLEQYLPKRSLRELWRSFQSMTALLPMGGARMALDSALRLAGFADHNGDGVVTADESLQDALDRAGFIDVDGDGSVSLEEAVTQALSPHGAGATPPGQDDEPYGEPELSEPAEHEDADGAAAEHGQAASGVDSLTGAIESAGDFHLSVEEVFDMMRVQDGGFMGQIDSFVDLNAWRPPSQAELDRATPPRPDGSRRYRATAGGLPRRYWSNPLSAPLPDAPSMTVLCLYGVGRPVERHYNMLAVRARPQEAWVDLEEAAAAGNDTIAVHGSALAPVPVEIASGFHRDPAAPDRGPRANGTRRRGAPSSGVGKPRGRGGPGRVSSGVTYTDGDGTVPAISLSLLCERHFRSREGNPGRARVVTRELPFTSSGGIEEELEGIAHTVRGAEAGEDEAAAEAGAEAAQWLEHITQAGLVRGTVDYLRSQGGATSEHIDILLNGRVMEAVVREAAGQDGAASASQWLSRRTRVTLGRATANLEGLTPWAEEEWAA